MTVRTIDEIFRDFVTDGVPASGPFNPHKSDIRDTLKALTEGSDNFPDNRVIRLNNADEGTANNIVVTASVAIPVAAYQVLYILNVTQENTGPVTVSGAISRALVTNINQSVPAGYLAPGMALLCVDTGTELRLLSYGDAEAVLAAAEAAAERAEDAAAAAEAAAATANGVAPVETRVQLKSLDHTEKKTAIVYAEGGRNGTFVFNDSDLSTEVATDTQEGIYVAPDSDSTGASGAWVRQYSGLADVRWFGAVLDDVADDTVAFNTALAVAEDALFPEGRAYIIDMIQVPTNGNLIGVGVARSVFSVKSDFNMSADGIVKLGTAEGAQLIDKIGFEFEQPSTGSRAEMNQYPYAINHNNIPRARIGHVRFSRAWNGINAGQNAGGATYDWIESGTLNKAISIDGALDTMNLGRFRVWPFGIGSAGDGGTGDVYRDGSNVGIDIGRCDGLAGEIQQFRTIAIFRESGQLSASRHLTSLHLDGDGADLNVYGGPLDIDFLYSTKSSAPTTRAIILDSTGSPDVRISNLYLKTSASSEPPILVNAGKLSVNSGLLDSRALAIPAARSQGTGVLSIRNVELTALGARTAAYVVCASATASLIVDDCWFPANSGTGVGIALTASATGSHVSGIVWNGRQFVSAASAAIGGVNYSVGGFVSGDATTTVLVPSGWTVSKVSTGNYSIVHNLGWTVSRQHVSAIIHGASFDVTVAIDGTNTTTNLLRLRTMVSGVATDCDFSFKIEHT